LLKPFRFLFLKVGARLFRGQTFTAFKLAEGALDLVMDGCTVVGQKRFFLWQPSTS
jgi:hypothetical protein